MDASLEDHATNLSNNDLFDLNSPDLCEQRCTDLSNAKRVYELADGKLIWVVNMGWFKWDNQCWINDDLEATRIASKLGKRISTEASNHSALAACEDQKLLRQGLESEAEALAKWARISESRQRIEAARELSKTTLAIEPEQLDAQPMKFATANGTLDLESFQIYPAKKEDLITKCSPVIYDPEAECPLWEKTLAEVFAHDPQLVPYIQRVCGYCLTGSVKEQVMFICYGSGANGKNVTIGAVMKAIGPYAVQAARNLLMRSRNERHPTELYDLKGTRMAVASETAESRRMDESLVKSLTGDDFIRARRMREDFIEFQPTHKLLLLTNHKPIIESGDYAIWRRIHLIPFTQTFKEDRRDLDLAKKLEAELPGILRWCVEGCREWQRKGLQPPGSVLEATQKYRNQMDIFEQYLDERCEFKGTNQVQASMFYRDYKQWCIDSGNDMKSRNWVWEKLEERGVTKKRTSAGVNYYGVGLINVHHEDYEHFSR